MVNTPYGPPTNTIAIIRKWRDAALPDQVTADWLRKIGIKESLIDANRRALTFLGLTDDSDNTTDTARRLAVVPSDQYASVLEEIVRAAYGPIFKLIDPRAATRTQIDDVFRGEKPESQRRRMVAFFLGLCGEAGMPLREPPQGGRTAAALSPKRQHVGARAANPRTNLPPPPPPPTPVPPTRDDSAPEGVLFHPAIDAFFREARKLTKQDSWNKQTRDFVIQAFMTQLDLFLPVQKAKLQPRSDSPAMEE
jgi:hypothetical protein